MAESYALSRLHALEVGAALRGMAADALSIEEVANRMVHYLHANLRGPDHGEPICALVRLFVTAAFDQLPPSLQEFGLRIASGQPIAPTTRCLTLMATAGDEPEWNSRHTSAGHQAIPLTSEEMVMQSPMIAQLVRQFGVDLRAVVAPDTRLMHPKETGAYNVFHVPAAANSPYVPAQDDFVKPYGIASVVGFGGPLTGGDLFAVILFSKANLTADNVSVFNGIALSAKLALLSIADKPVFSPVNSTGSRAAADGGPSR